MNRMRMLIVAVLALILSVGITYLAYRLLRTRLQPAETTDKVVVAARKLDLGTLIAEKDVQLMEWPKSTPLEGTFSDPALVIDRATMVPLQVNEPVLEPKLAPKGAGSGLTAMIPQGMRALTIQVNSIIGVAGFVLPGSHVDLILTSVPPADVKGVKANETASKIILENLEVLAAGQNVQHDVDGKPQSVQDVTLLLTPEQAQKVALATGDGRIQLALRNPMDKEAAEPPLVIRTTLYTGSTTDTPKDASTTKAQREKAAALEKPMTSQKAVRSVKASPPRKRPAAAEAPAVAPPPQPRVLVIELIQGSRRATQTFQENNPEQTETPALPDKTPQRNPEQTETPTLPDRIPQ